MYLQCLSAHAVEARCQLQTLYNSLRWHVGQEWMPFYHSLATPRTNSDVAGSSGPPTVAVQIARWRRDMRSHPPLSDAAHAFVLRRWLHEACLYLASSLLQRPAEDVSAETLYFLSFWQEACASL